MTCIRLELTDNARSIYALYKELTKLEGV